MKKTLNFLLVIVFMSGMLFSLTACGDEGKESSSKSSNKNNANTSSKTGIIVGDEVNLNGENFYIIGNNEDNTKVYLLAKNCINLDTLEQDESIGKYSAGSTSGAIRFLKGSFGNTTVYWKTDDKEIPDSKYGTSYPVYVYDDNSNLYDYVEKYAAKFNATGRLLTYEEAKELKEKNEKLLYTNDAKSDNGNVLYYWTGSAGSDYQVYTIKNGIYNSTAENGGQNAIRPVLEVNYPINN